MGGFAGHDYLRDVGIAEQIDESNDAWIDYVEDLFGSGIFVLFVHVFNSSSIDFESNFYFFDFIRVVVILNLKFLSILFCCEIIRLGSPKPGPE